jgi:peptidase YpeB-like protein
MSERFARMMERGPSGLVAAGLAALLLVAGSVAAQPRPLSPRQAETVDEPLEPAQRDRLFPAQRAGGVSLAQATAMAQSRFPGRVVRAEPVQMGDRVVYEIRILDAEGVVRNVRIDAQTGSFL